MKSVSSRLLSNSLQVEGEGEGCMDGTVVRALACHQCGPGLGVKCGLSLLVLFSALRGFSPGTPVFPSPQKPTFPNSNSIWNVRTYYEQVLLSSLAFHG